MAPAMPARAPKMEAGKKQETVNPVEHSCPPGYRVLAVPTASGYCEPPGGTAEATSTGCQHGMVGRPPNCHCPKNSELLGGNCIHYSATCRNGLAADFTPQLCEGADENARMQNASRRIEGLLLFDPRPAVGMRVHQRQAARAAPFKPWSMLLGGMAFSQKLIDIGLTKVPGQKQSSSSASRTGDPW